MENEPDPQVFGNIYDPSPSTVNQQSSPPIKPKRKFHWYVLIIVVAIILVGVGLVVGISIEKKSSSKVNSVANTANIKKAVAATSTLSPTGYLYYAAPQRQKDLNFFQNLGELFGTECSGNQTTDCPPIENASDISYYAIGLTKSEQPIIIAADYTKGGQASFFYVAIESTTGQYQILGKLSGLDPTASSDQSAISNLKNDISSNVSLNTTDTIPDFTFPQNQTVNGEDFALPGYSGPSGQFINGLSGIRGSYYNTTIKLSDIVKVGQSKPVTFYEVTVQDKVDYQVKEIYGAIGGVYASTYVPNDPLTSTSAPDIRWDDGSTDNNTYTNAAQGCGSANGYLVMKNLNPSQLIKVGKGPNSETIYELPTSSALFNDYYKTDYAGGADLLNPSIANLSATQFQSDHAIIIAKNAIGEYVIYERGDFTHGGGCGKPVIYLYPQQATSVNIQVGANVTKSDPFYTQNGWKNVLAQAGSKLTYQGNTYNSLFWEGIGFGTYPSIDTGTIVPKSKLASTLRQQLNEQGLTTTEINDFMSYWQPKLPTTPYTRLTWFNTAQMNELAPLQVSPKPTSSIRVFLDFQGLNMPISIKPQSLHSTKRTGFTLVEWGGLLRNN
jgi:hypothetical protein